MTLGTSVFPAPATQALNTTNALGPGTGTLLEESNNCLSLHGYLPTFTLVDFYDMGQGSVFGSSYLPASQRVRELISRAVEYAAKLNGVTYVATTIGNATSSSSAAGSSSTPQTSSTSLPGSAPALKVTREAFAWGVVLLAGVGSATFLS